ncbi:FMN-binding negative transcriptional regulator [Leifsonia sp. 21MFCrub1.1]|uniref:FMN-binding negative transcriptional regulator n=1 Tax=Leifsonia sp. 21MFCrub1.1 TaxID=1798223 RepID=UPI0008929C28|nr:FMN-binding negative transcriptional regulator [Leifsonia sp. 21MFCrub1.1]SEA86375.1 negative transcriptional regulator, PaiB family [Leifsonia sp. 21MFCrub1.1]
MRQNPSFTLTDPAELKRLVRENPWATFVSSTSNGLVASHYPVILDETREELTLLSHVGRPDEQLHELGEHELLVIVQGPHGYISSGWYDEKPAVPTWNFIAAHFSGVPELLSDEENLEVLARLVDHFEGELPEPRRMRGTPADAQYAERIVSGTVGLRLTPTRVVAKQKMSQNRPDHIVDAILGELGGDGPYASAGLLREMQIVHDRRRAAR